MKALTPSTAKKRKAQEVREHATGEAHALLGELTWTDKVNVVRMDKQTVTPHVSAAKLTSAVQERHCSKQLGSS